jgi:hypothetical protein
MCNRCGRKNDFFENGFRPRRPKVKALSFVRLGNAIAAAARKLQDSKYSLWLPHLGKGHSVNTRRRT